jgi:type I restriction enzyme S subunit
MGVMTESSKSWKLARFDYLLRRVERKILVDDEITYDCVGVRWYGHGAFIREKELGMNIARKQQWVINSGDVVYNKLFAWKGAFAIADNVTDGCIVSDKFPTYRIDQDLVEPKFLQFYFQTPQLARQAQDLSKGAAAISKLTLNPPQFWDLTIPLPSLEEQRHIVERIEALAGRVREALFLRKEAIEEADAVRLSYLQEIYNRYSSEIKTLGDYSIFISDGTHVTPAYTESGIPFVTVRNIANRKLTFDNIKYISQEQHEIYCRRVKPEYGDVLYTKDGTLGVPCFVDVDRKFSFFVSVAIIKPKRELLDGRYLTYILDAPQIHEQVTDTKTGAVLQHIVIRAIKSIKLPVPPLNEQHRIVAYLDSLQAQVNELRRLQAETREELRALMPSILDRAFKGEL